jgi:signal transduction histidine kinase
VRAASPVSSVAKISAMTEGPSLEKIRSLESRIQELSREGEQRGADPVFQSLLNNTLRLLAQERAKELERVSELYRGNLHELEMHKRRMATTVHDLKAPITVSLLNLELLQMEESPAQAAAYLSGVRRELEFMLDTIANLLDLERSAEEQLEHKSEPVPLGPLVDSVLQRMNVLITDKPELRLVNGLEPNLPPVRGHVHQFTRVFNNLLSNAIKYTERGHIRVAGALVHGESGVRVEVQDTGQGIDPERIPHLFAYYRGDEERIDSTGVGLAFVKQTVESHGGRVWLESVRGEGTRVFLDLNVWEEELREGE